jgi:CrcB protein
VTRLLWVCLGGAFGTGCRYLLAGAMIRAFGPGFPSGTLAVNLLGSFVAGALTQAGPWLGPPDGELRLALTIGVLGGFTTYSAFNSETLILAQRGAFGTAALYGSVTVVGCLITGLLGIAVGKNGLAAL